MDNLTPEQRRKTMKAVRSANTSLERRFFSTLSERDLEGLSFHRDDIFGHPDIVHETGRIAIFLDSCFWHACPKHLQIPASNTEYWKRKIRRNKSRDREVTRRLERQGWLVLRIWGHSVKNQRSRRWWATRICTLVAERT
ncbi:MAG: very short patch repair endonuclease [Candidatus Paceibacterota bacterium]